MAATTGSRISRKLPDGTRMFGQKFYLSRYDSTRFAKVLLTKILGCSNFFTVGESAESPDWENIQKKGQKLWRLGANCATKLVQTVASYKKENNRSKRIC
jgi:hypothetical protein